MVSYNIAQNITDSYTIVYSHSSNHSNIIPINQNILESMQLNSVNSITYIRTVKQRKMNINPILTDRNTDRIKLKILFIYYGVKSFLKTILGR